MKSRIEKEIAYLEFEIEEHRRSLKHEVNNFKNWISSGDAGRIARIPQTSLFQDIQSDYITIQKLDEKKRWLLHLLKDLEKE